MENWIVNIIKEIKSCDDLLALKSTLVKIKEKLGFTNVLYAVRFPNTFRKMSYFIISDYTEDWIVEYSKNSYFEIDPVMIHCSTHHDPCCWDDFQLTDDKVIKKFFKHAEEFGLAGGVSIGMHGYNGDKGVFSLAADHKIKTGSDKQIKSTVYLSAFLPYIHTAITGLSTYKETKPYNPELTTRELDCLLWSAEGKTADEIAHILSIKNATVVFHLKNVIRKLNVSNRNQAIAKAILFGFISPQHSTTSATVTYHF